MLSKALIYSILYYFLFGMSPGRRCYDYAIHSRFWALVGLKK